MLTIFSYESTFKISLLHYISVDENLKVGEMEQELLVTYDPAVVKDLVQKVASKVGNNQAVFLTDLVFTTFYVFQDFFPASTLLNSFK